MEYLYVFLILVIIVYVWFMLCNHRTYKQRVDTVLYDRTGRYNYDNITYGQHLWLLFTFRNALKRYEKVK